MNVREQVKAATKKYHQLLKSEKADKAVAREWTAYLKDLTKGGDASERAEFYTALDDSTDKWKQTSSDLGQMLCDEIIVLLDEAEEQLEFEAGDDEEEEEDAEEEEEDY